MVRRESRRGLDSLRMPVGGILVLSVRGEEEEGFALGRRGGEGRGMGDGLRDLRPTIALPRYRPSTYSHRRNDHLDRE